MSKLCGILVAMLLTVLSGCHPPSEVEMLKHLEKKYGKEFSSISVENDGPREIMICHEKDGDPEDEVEVWRIFTDKYLYYDTYFGNLISGEVEKDINDLLEGFEVPFKAVYYSSDYYGSEYVDPSQYAEFKARERDGETWQFDIFLAVVVESEEEFQDCVREVQELLGKTDMRLRVFMSSVAKEYLDDIKYIKSFEDATSKTQENYGMYFIEIFDVN